MANFGISNPIGIKFNEKVKDLKTLDGNDALSFKSISEVKGI